MLLLLLACTPIAVTDTAELAEDSAMLADTSVRPSDRKAWLVEAIDNANAALSAEDRRAKFCAMAESPHRFYRGTAHLYWADHAALPERQDPAWTTWVSGDLHVANLGSFHDDDDRVVWDINDHDEAALADARLDLGRALVSLSLVAHERGWADEPLHDQLAGGYVDTMAALEAGASTDDLVVDESNATGAVAALLDDVRDKDRKDLLDRWSVPVNGTRKFLLDDPDLAELSTADRAALAAAMPSYAARLTGATDWPAEAYAVQDAALRLNAGTGSLGLRRIYVLIEGPTSNAADDRLLDVKQQPDPSAASALPAQRWSEQADLWANNAERVVLARRAQHDDVDDLLGWLALPDGAYSVMERSPWRGRVDLSLASEAQTGDVARQLGLVTAAAHTRANRFRPLATPVRIEATVAAAHRGDFLADQHAASSAYAAIVRSDFATFLTERAPADCTADDR